jgi:hypothetical protein
MSGTSYLELIGVNPVQAVKLIVATHWHSDHVLGLSDLVATCPSAQFVCSAALRPDEFQELVARFAPEGHLGRVSAPLGEIRKIFVELASRKKRGDPRYQAPIFAQAHQLIAVPGATQVMTLSPSPQDCEDARRAFAEYFVPLDQSATGLSPIEQNHASVAMTLVVDEEVFLLGAVLENKSSALSGWNAVLNSELRPEASASVFKVPHHGSSNAYSEEVWARMVASTANAIVTPYVNSGLPRAIDIRRLKQKHALTYATALPQKVARLRRRPELTKAISEGTRNFITYRRPDDPGVVRLRKLLGRGNPWHVELFGSAISLADVEV